LVKAAAANRILYVPSIASSLFMEEIATAKPHEDQIYVSTNETENKALFQRIEQTGAKALVLTVDSAGDRTPHRVVRYVPDINITRGDEFHYMTWDFFQEIQSLTRLPIIPKGIQSVEDAKMAAKIGVRAIFLSNHGGRALDGSPSAFDVTLEIRQKAPEIFDQMEVYADGGIRYGTDVLKLLALGVRAVGLGRPFMFANMYGAAGVSKALNLLRQETISAAANVGVADIQRVTPEYVDF
ncbi:FMN-dependent dehydrogenase, partial [Ilyonectria robusta]|uniref:FMN-dependent dehydrogenase n=1 Tax=Ilyonectria robusta TaxID=1079257 RepID=UPI001E8CEC76